ncbi:phospholipase D family protein [Rhodococcus koreensis]|uniref:phospholipase D family protein n=1 Tax=Rhodococcus koreensis TaxID=99653 RepID=UPI001F124334|nr:phospholipase D family protein [Rhodococcus koreensis]
MGTTFHGPSPWPHITRAIRTRGARYAAIGYLGQDAPDLLPLRAGDLLVVNASKAAIRAHATSPAALAHYLNKGVRVLSSPTLHAKVIATNTRAVIGSANASENSTLADDAVVITDDPEIIASVRKFIDSLDEITEVDQVFLDDAIREWEIGRAVPLPGVTGRVRIETDFLPTPVTRMFVKHAVDYEPTRTEQQVLDEQRGRHHSRGGPAAKYQLESLRLDRPSGVKRGDGWRSVGIQFVRYSGTKAISPLQMRGLPHPSGSPAQFSVAGWWSHKFAGTTRPSDHKGCVSADRAAR